MIANVKPKPRFDQDRIRQLPIRDIRPSPENEALYRPVVASDPEVKALAESIRELGIQEPLVVSSDGFILSGHRRHVAARLAGLQTVPCRVYPIQRDVDRDQFVRLLREFNRQRVKSRDEQLREEIISADPEESYQALLAHRQTQEAVAVETIELRGQKRRAGISKAKTPFLQAVQAIIAERRKFWPLSVRQVHYALLNDPPLIHASKPDSTYTNTKASYAALVDLLTRARVEGHVSMSCIDDQTRPTFIWEVHRDVNTFMREELDGFLKGYWRDLMQSQPNHVEIVGEKNTIAPIIKPVAARYCIPCTLGRGYCSTPPKHDMAQRYRKSGKGKLLLLILSDFDPDGEEIAHSLARSLRDDFDIPKVEPIKVALTAAHVREFNLPPMLQAKESSANYSRFVDRHGTDVFELEAIAPEALQRLLTEAIDAVIDVEAINHEIDQEKQDAAFLAATRRRVYQELGDLLRDQDS